MPKDVKKVLAKSNKNSAPGPDGISYGVLSKLDSCTHTLATLYSKVLAMGSAPPSWGESVVKPIHKKDDPSDPTNFRMISLTVCIGKTFHLLLADRLTSYLTSNHLVDPTMKKALLPGINGCIEHKATMEEIIMDDKLRKLTCHMTFFDLEDAFGSIPHSLVHETLIRNFLPPNILNYFKSCYGNSQSVVQTPQWRSNPFPFRRGVFQGDPISPIVFLMAFNPVLLQLQLQADKIG